MSHSKATITALAVACLLQAGCGGRPTRPVVTDVTLSLSVSPEQGDPSQPVAADVRVLNAGTTRVWHCRGCGCGNGISITVLGPEGTEVLIRDPNGPVPLCLDFFAELEPGQDLRERMDFTGTLYAPGNPGYPSSTYPAPAGTYTVIARFSYATRIPEWMPLEHRATFDWVH